MKKKFNIGDRVKVKAYSEIEKTFTKREKQTKGVYFPDSFKSYCGKKFIISGYDRYASSQETYKLEGLEMGKVFVEDWLEKANPDRIIFRDNATILIKDGKRYVAKCCDGDTYDREKGLLVCLAKAHGYTFNDLQEMLKGAEMQGNAAPQSKVREVKRRAEVGEYVKVVGNVTYHHFSNGEIVKCVRLDRDRVDKFSYIDERDFYYMRAEEYVVLENYNPNTYPYNVPKETIQKALRIINQNGIGFDTKTEVKEFYELIKGKFKIIDFDNNFRVGTKFFDGYECCWDYCFMTNYTYKQLKAKILELLGE